MPACDCFSSGFLARLKVCIVWSWEDVFAAITLAKAFTWDDSHVEFDRLCPFSVGEGGVVCLVLL